MFFNASIQEPKQNVLTTPCAKLEAVDVVEDVKPVFGSSVRRVLKKSRKWLEKHGRQNVLQCPECTVSPDFLTI